MTETILVNLFLTIRVAVVGGLLFVLPHITRTGLLFGVYTGEDRAESEEARRLLREWNRGCVLLMALALLVGYSISGSGRPMTGNLTGTAVLLLGAGALYVRTHARARTLIPETVAGQAAEAAAPLDSGAPSGEGAARFALVVTLVAGLATVIVAIVGYDSMPDRIPSMGSMFGGDPGLSEKSIAAVLFFPSLNLIASPFYALLALLMATAKRSIRSGSGGRSAEAQNAFRAVNARLLAAMALMIGAGLTFLSVQVVRVGQGQIDSVGVAIWWASGGFVLFMGGGLIWIMKRYGQGGARLEEGGPGAPLAGGLASDARWVGGLFYVDRDDPSMMVEKRFGIGYTLNYGNRYAVFLTVTFSMLILALVAVAFIADVF